MLRRVADAMILWAFGFLGTVCVSVVSASLLESACPLRCQSPSSLQPRGFLNAVAMSCSSPVRHAPIPSPSPPRLSGFRSDFHCFTVPSSNVTCQDFDDSADVEPAFVATPVFQRSRFSCQTGRIDAHRTGLTCQRTAADESTARSDSGRAKSTSARPLAAASCRRRVAAILNCEPSATTALMAGHRTRRSSTHKRVGASGGSIRSASFVTCDPGHISRPTHAVHGPMSVPMSVWPAVRTACCTR